MKKLMFLHMCTAFRKILTIGELNVYTIFFEIV